MAEVISGKTVQKEDKVDTKFMGKKQLSDVIQKAGSVVVEEKLADTPSDKPIGRLIPEDEVKTSSMARRTNTATTHCDICDIDISNKNYSRHMGRHERVAILHPKYVATIPENQRWDCPKCGMTFTMQGKSKHLPGCDGKPRGLDNISSYSKWLETHKSVEPRKEEEEYMTDSEIDVFKDKIMRVVLEFSNIESGDEFAAVTEYMDDGVKLLEQLND